MLNDVSLAGVNDVRDLGVGIDSHLTFHTHYIANSCARYSVRAGLIQKCFIAHDIFTLVRTCF